MLYRGWFLTHFLLPSQHRGPYVELQDGKGSTMMRDQRAKIYLETQRLTLREFEADDLDALVELDSDPEVMRYISGGAPSDREVIRTDVLPRWLAYHKQAGGFGYWAAIEKASGAFIGWFHFRRGDRVGEIELGYRLKQSAWGKGYATEGARALIAKGFNELGVDRVVAPALKGNAASIRVMERAGLRFVQDIPVDHFHGEGQFAVKYALDRADFDSKRYGHGYPAAP